MARSALIMRAGQSGLPLAHGLLAAGWQVTHRRPSSWTVVVSRVMPGVIGVREPRLRTFSHLTADDVHVTITALTRVFATEIQACRARIKTLIEPFPITDFTLRPAPPSAGPAERNLPAEMLRRHRTTWPQHPASPRLTEATAHVYAPTQGRDAQGSDQEPEPSDSELAAIDAHAPVTEAEVRLVDAEIAVLTAGHRSATDLDWQRVHSAERHVLAAWLALAAHQATPAEAAA